jgi:hypothetical protein
MANIFIINSRDLFNPQLNPHNRWDANRARVINAFLTSEKLTPAEAINIIEESFATRPEQKLGWFKTAFRKCSSLDEAVELLEKYLRFRELTGEYRKFGENLVRLIAQYLREETEVDFTKLQAQMQRLKNLEETNG